MEEYGNGRYYLWRGETRGLVSLVGGSKYVDGSQIQQHTHQLVAADCFLFVGGNLFLPITIVYRFVKIVDSIDHRKNEEFLH